jgi:ribosomal protein L32
MGVFGGETMTTCPVCGVAVDSHERCRDCGIMVGPGHLEERVTSKDGMCSGCVSYWRTQKARGATHRHASGRGGPTKEVRL